MQVFGSSGVPPGDKPPPATAPSHAAHATHVAHAAVSGQPHDTALTSGLVFGSNGSVGGLARASMGEFPYSFSLNVDTHFEVW